MTVEHRNSLSKEVYQKCLEFFDTTGFNDDTIKMFRQVSSPENWHLATIRLGELLHLANVNEIWNFTSIREISLEYKETEYHLTAHVYCDLDEEHGLNIIFKSGWKAPLLEEVFKS